MTDNKMDRCAPELDLSSGNIGAALHKYYPNGNPKESIYKVIDKLFEIFGQSFGIMDRPGTDKSNLAFFDPASGVWETDDDMFRMIVGIIKPGLGDNSFGRFKRCLADICRREHRIIREYTGSRYIAFKNGVLDVATLDLLPSSSFKVQDLHLTVRNKLSVSWNPNAQPVTFPGKGCSGGDWNIKNYFMAYAEEDDEQYRFLMFLLSLGLFGSHTFGVNVFFLGKSGIGKTVMMHWLENLYQIDQPIFLSFLDMDKRSPLSKRGYHRTILHVNEVSKRMNQPSGRGISFYNALADGMVDSPVKPGPAYFEGTVPMEVDTVEIGFRQRTLVYLFPNNLTSSEIQYQYYSDNLGAVQEDPRNLEWFVKECIGAYRYYVPTSRMDDFRLNLASSEDIELLPDFAKQWREKAIISSNGRFSH